LQGVDSGIKFLIKGLFVLLRIKIHRNQSGTREPLRFDGADLACQQCHDKIAPEAKFCPQCHAVILRRYCPGCKKLVPDHAPNCPYCGTSATQKSKERILLDSTNATPLILGLSFVALLSLWLYQKPERETPSSRIRGPDKVITPSSPISSHQQSIQASEQKISTSELEKSSQISAAKNVQKGARLNLKGHKLIKLGRYREAVPLLHQAIDTFPEDTRTIDYVYAQYNLAHSLRKIGKSDEAIPYLERCVAYDRQNRMFQRELQAARRDLAIRNNY
jgi:RNA polymerase subunit RPABC4/transcription elongation factor Spt4